MIKTDIALDEILNKNLDYKLIDFNEDYNELVIELSDNIDYLINNKIHLLSPELKFKLALTHLSKQYVSELAYHIIKPDNDKSPTILLGLLKYNPMLINNKDFYDAIKIYEYPKDFLQLFIYTDIKGNLYYLLKNIFPDYDFVEFKPPERDMVSVISLIQNVIKELDEITLNSILDGNQRIIKSLPGKIMKIDNRYNPKGLNELFSSIIEELKIYYHFVHNVKWVGN